VESIGKMLMAKRKKKKTKEIDWEYCECGCHCNTVTLNGNHYSYLLKWEKKPDGSNDFSKELHYLTKNQPWNWKKFDSKEALEGFVRKDALKSLEEFKKQIFEG